MVGPGTSGTTRDDSAGVVVRGSRGAERGVISFARAGAFGFGGASFTGTVTGSGRGAAAATTGSVFTVTAGGATGAGAGAVLAVAGLGASGSRVTAARATTPNKALTASPPTSPVTQRV